MLGELQDRIYRFIYALLKIGGNIKDAMLDWLGGCIHANAGMVICLYMTGSMPLLFSCKISSLQV